MNEISRLLSPEERKTFKIMKEKVESKELNFETCKTGDTYI